MSIDKKIMHLYAVTDRSWLNGRTLEEAVEKALKGGVTLVQLREKNMRLDELIQEAKKIKVVCEKYDVPLIINDSVEAVLASDADGVHLGQSDMTVKHAREVLGNNTIIGATAKTVLQAQKAEFEGADYIGSGAIFCTATKSDAKKLDIVTLREITKSVSIPVVAIGGINAENISELKNTGIAGAAVVSGIFAQDDIETAAKNLYKKTGEII